MPDDSRLITPETTPHSIPTNPATAPGGAGGDHILGVVDQVASTLKSSPAPVGRFLICKPAITAPPHRASAWPDISDKLVGVALAFARLYEPLTSCSAPDSWNSPQAWSTRILPTTSGER